MEAVASMVGEAIAGFISDKLPCWDGNVRDWMRGKPRWEGGQGEFQERKINRSENTGIKLNAGSLWSSSFERESSAVGG